MDKIVVFNGRTLTCECGCILFDQPWPENAPNQFVCITCGNQYDLEPLERLDS